jgi:hypothetical protein
MIGLSLQVKGNKQLDTKHYFKVSQFQNDELLLLPTLVSVAVWPVAAGALEPVVLPIYIGRRCHRRRPLHHRIVGHHHLAARLLNHPNITYVYC